MAHVLVSCTGYWTRTKATGPPLHRRSQFPMANFVGARGINCRVCRKVCTAFPVQCLVLTFQIAARTKATGSLLRRRCQICTDKFPIADFVGARGISCRACRDVCTAFPVQCSVLDLCCAFAPVSPSRNPNTNAISVLNDPSVQPEHRALDPFRVAATFLRRSNETTNSGFSKLYSPDLLRHV